MKFKRKYRYVLMTGDVPMMQRKRLFWFGWYNYESFDNAILEVEEKLNELDAKMQKEYDKWTDFKKQRRAVINQVNNARGEFRGEGHVRTMKFDLFPMRVKDLPSVGDRWTRFLNVLKHGKSASQNPEDDMEGMRVVGSDNDSPTEVFVADANGNTEVVNQRNYDIKPKSNNQNKKQNKQGQQQQHQDNNQGN